MSLEDRLRNELDHMMVGEPAPRPVEAYAVAGRRSLRRRRIAVGASVCGVAIVLGAGYAAATPQAGRDAGKEAVGTSRSPSPTSAPGPIEAPTTQPSPSAVVTQAPWGEHDLPVRYVAGVLQVRPGTEVHQHLENPYGYEAPRYSDAYDLTYDGTRMWVIIEHTGRGDSDLSSMPSNGWASFRAWVEDQVAAGGTTTQSGWPMTMTLTADGRVVAAQGAQVFNRTDHPDLGPRFAPPGATTGAAVVRPYGADLDYFVVWRVIDGQLDVITTPPRDTVGASFEELLTSARASYASGEGLR